MNQSLNELFSTLVQSEQAAEEQKNQFMKAKRNVQTASENIKKEATRRCEILEEIQALEKHLDGVEAATEEVKLKEEFLRDKASEIQSQNRDKTNEVSKLRETLKSQSMQFMEQVKKFSGVYGLLYNSRGIRLENAKAGVEKLKTETEALQRDIAQKKASLEEMRELLEKRNGLLEANEKLTSIEKDINESIRDEDTQIQQLQTEIMTLQITPEVGEEFLQVNEDLEKYKTDDLETQAEELHAQLSAITDRLRRQEGQALKKQYRWWQRQRQMKQVDLQESRHLSRGNHEEGYDDSSRQREVQAKLHEDESAPQDDNGAGGDDALLLLGLTGPPEIPGKDRRKETHSTIRSLVALHQSTGTDKTRASGLVWQKGRQKDQQTMDRLNNVADHNDQPHEIEMIQNFDSQIDQFTPTNSREADGLNSSAVRETHNQREEECSAVSDEEGNETNFVSSAALKLTTSSQSGQLSEDERHQTRGATGSQEDILCPSPSTADESAIRSGQSTLGKSSQNTATIFISSP